MEELKDMKHNGKYESCSACEMFKNHQGNTFALGFFCPIQNKFVFRDDFACDDILSDNLPF